MIRKLLALEFSFLLVLLPVFGQAGIGGKSAIGGKASIGGSGGVSVNFGWDFRATSGFVTDPSYAVFEGGATVFPHTYTNANSESINAGFVSITTTPCDAAPTARDRNASNDPRLAGIVFPSGSNGSSTDGQCDFEITLPTTGSYTINLAMGDGANQQTQFVIFEDNTVTFASESNVSTGSNSFMDASGVVETAANWPSTAVTISHTFTSTRFDILIGSTTTGTDSSTIAFLGIVH